MKTLEVTLLFRDPAFQIFRRIADTAEEGWQIVNRQRIERQRKTLFVAVTTNRRGFTRVFLRGPFSSFLEAANNLPAELSWQGCRVESITSRDAP